MSETSNTEDTRSTGQKVSDWIGDQLRKTKPVQTIEKAAKAIDDFNNSDYVKQNAEKWKKWNDDRNAREAAERQAHEEYINSDEYKAQQEAEEEAKRKAEEERKAKELEKRQGIYDEVMGNIRNSSKTADTATTKAAFELGSAGGTDNYEDLGRSRSAGMSMADDATIAAKSIAQNAMANRRTAFDEAVKAGSDKLKAEGYDKAAGNLEEAAKQQSEAQLQSNITNGAIGLYTTLSDLFKGIDL
jgi:membrane protein involved in colicin uptake